MTEKLKEGFHPTHRMFPSIGTGFPGVVLDNDPRLESPVPSIQWDGIAQKEGEELSLPMGNQFLFGLMIYAEDYRWHYYERDDTYGEFQVAFLGKVRDIPEHKAGLRFAAASICGPDDYVAILSCGRVIVPETLLPSTFMVKVIPLIDEGGVVITPKLFVRLEVLDEQVEISLQELQKRAEEQGMDD